MANALTVARPLPQPPSALGLDSLTVADYLSRWLAHARTRVRPATYDGYESLVRCHVNPFLGSLPLAELHPLHLQDLYADRLNPTPPQRALSASTVLNLHLLISQSLRQAVRWQLLTTNPAAGAQPPRPRRPQQLVATGETLKQILRHLRGHPLLELPTTIALTTGMRRGEILGLRWGDLTPDHTSAHIQQTLQATRTGLHYQQPKTHRSRRPIALPATLAALLDKHLLDQDNRRLKLGQNWQDTDLIVERGDGRPINPDTLSSLWRRFVREHDLPPVRFHDLRHTHATLMLLEGIHPKIVSERLGHATIGITLDTYTHLLPSMQHEAAAAIDRIFEIASA
jgi:integrase